MILWTVWTRPVYNLRISHTQHYIMRVAGLSGDAVAAIDLGILQLGIGLLSLWQQCQLRRAYRKYHTYLQTYTIHHLSFEHADTKFKIERKVR
jgi:hypothetical protein